MKATGPTALTVDPVITTAPTIPGREIGGAPCGIRPGCYDRFGQRVSQRFGSASMLAVRWGLSALTLGLILTDCIESVHYGAFTMAKKQSSPSVSSVASKVLRTGKATQDEAQQLAASVLSQDEKKGQKK